MPSRRKLRFLVDRATGEPLFEYLSGIKKATAFNLQSLGLDQRRDDDDLIAIAIEQGAILVTSDKGFTETFRPMCQHEGIIKLECTLYRGMQTFKRFMKRPERHEAWKAVTHLHADGFVMHKHDNYVRAVTL